MEKVYRNSALNLAATGAINSSKGLFSKRDPASVSVCTVQSNWSDRDNGMFALIDLDLWAFHVNASALLQRAWVQQELILAQRVLHFGQHQLLWDCYQMNACETFKGGLHPAILFQATRLEVEVSPQLPLISLRPEASTDTTSTYLSWWARIIAQYTGCLLTKESDKLAALSGLAKMLGPMLQATYLAGLWSTDIAYQLLWEIATPIPKDSVRRPRLYRAPSWSWAAIEAPVVITTTFSHEDIWPLVRVLDWEIIPVAADMTGQIQSGLINMCANLFPVDIVSDELMDDPFSTQSDTRHTPVFTIQGCRREVLASACLDEPLKSQQELAYAVPLICTSEPEQQFQIRGILLKKANHHGPTSFSRLGAFRVDDDFSVGELNTFDTADQQPTDELGQHAKVLANELIERAYGAAVMADVEAMMDEVTQQLWIEKAKGISERAIERITVI
ncbi:MAG: hypothetical protein Q9213_004894 [Squamulea squamosa]